PTSSGWRPPTAAAGTGSRPGSRPTSGSTRRSSASAPRSDGRTHHSRSAAVIDGLLVVDKPAGWTSHDVVAKLRGATRQRPLGHAGTLDPDATGVLLVGLGRVTRLLRFLQDTTKGYRGVVAFGVATSTLDAAGEELARAEMPVTEAEVRAAMTAFLGDI